MFLDYTSFLKFKPSIQNVPYSLFHFFRQMSHESFSAFLHEHRLCNQSAFRRLTGNNSYGPLFSQTPAPSWSISQAENLESSSLQNVAKNCLNCLAGKSYKTHRMCVWGVFKLHEGFQKLIGPCLKVY